MITNAIVFLMFLFFHLLMLKDLAKQSKAFIERKENEKALGTVLLMLWSAVLFGGLYWILLGEVFTSGG